MHGIGLSDDTPYFSRFIDGRRGEILDAAMAVFAQKGYDCGTMREIAERLSVTEPALYRHYASKEALFSDLVAQAGNHIADRAAAGMDRIRPEELRESLAELLESRRKPHGERSARPIIGMLLMAAPHNDSFRGDFREHIAVPMIHRLEELVPRVDAHFGIVRDPAETTGSVRAFMSLFVGSFMTAMLFDDSAGEQDEATVDAMLAIMGWDRVA
jgi:AcrR family transcriptional regulator